MKNIVYIAKNSYKAALHFYKNESGVYSVIMGLISVVLVGLIAFAVDGSGLLLDKARFVQGMEQASLALVAENNAYRQNQEHDDVTRQKSNDSNETLNLDQQQKQRNQELIRGIVQSYYLGNTYRSNPQADNKDITDEYNYDCHLVDSNANGIPKTVACNVSGNFDRPSWLYLKDQALSFKEFNKVSSGSVYAQKNQDEVIPLDLMLVSDFSGSMNDPLLDKNQKEVKDQYGHSQPKVKVLKEVVESVSADLLDSKKAKQENRNISPFNRIGFVSFAFGAQQRGDAKKCYIPFFFDSESNLKTAKDLLATHGKRDLAYPYFNEHVDLEKTVNQIEKFNGEDIEYPFSFAKSYSLCLHENASIMTTSNNWFGQNQHDSLSTQFSALKASGSTLSSSGLLIGANYLMLKNTDSKAQPSVLKTNTQRIILVLSDGRDQIHTDITVTTDLIKTELCSKIKSKIDSLQDSNYTTRPTRIAFVAFGYELKEDTKKAWRKCVGDYYYQANSKQQLLDTFHQILNLNEEVGHSLNSEPKYYN